MGKRIKIKINDKFNRLTVIKTDGSKNGHIIYICKCDCGNFHKSISYHLTRNFIKSCGCLKSELQSKRNGYVTFRRIYTQYRTNAKIRNLNFDLTENEFENIIEKNCYYCNESPKLTNKYLNADNSIRDFTVNKKTIERAWLKANGVDRMDSNLGYTLNNSVACCGNCNKMKRDFPYNEFIERCKKIAGRF